VEKMPSLLAMTFAASSLILVASAIDAQQKQDKYSVKVPEGLAFSEFRGYEDWAVIADQCERRSDT
jgi:hypothetical protein